MGTRNVVDSMKQMGVKSYDNQVRYNTPIKFKSTQTKLKHHLQSQTSQAKSPNHMLHKIVFMPIMC
jgi:hypothetical protein